MVPSGLLMLALLAPTAPPVAGAGLQRGDELTYTGTVTETVDRPGARFRRAHILEIRVFVLDRRGTSIDAAVLTTLQRTDDGAVSGAAAVVTGRTPDAVRPTPAARLDLVRVDDDGTTVLLLPTGPAPLQLDANTPIGALPVPPLNSFAPFEFGMFPPRPGANQDQRWALPSTDPTRPAERWETKGVGLVNAEQCPKMVMVQQSANWDSPRGGQTDWQRVDEIWASTRNGTTRRAHRAIRQRDGIGPEASVCIDVAYQLKDQSRLIRQTYDDCRREIEVAYAASADLAPLWKEAAHLGPQPFATRLAKLAPYLDDTDPGTPYRVAIRAVARQIDAARRGEAAPVLTLPLPVAPQRPHPPTPGPQVGKPAPDFQAGEFRLSSARGQPVVLVFFMPGVETTELSLAIAGALQKRYGDRIAVVPLVVYGEVAAVGKDRGRSGLSIPLREGTSAIAGYAVETVPRFFVIDRGGAMRWMFAGVGAETGFLVREQVDALLNAPSVNPAPTGTGSPPTRLIGDPPPNP